RLVPQVVYYFYGYLQMAAKGEIKLGEEINVSVPTGNFGNILAGYFAKKMGLPVKTFICASNKNNVLYDFFTTGTYNKNREFSVTTSPSMDILVSSNLERFISMATGQETCKNLMDKLNTEGSYTIDELGKEIIGQWATEEETWAAIKTMFEETNYILDTHTAVSYAAYKKYKNTTNDETPTMIVSTASPYKFTKDVMVSIDRKYEKMDFFPLMDEMAKISNIAIPEPICGIENKPILHKTVIEKDNIKTFVKSYLLNN
ncbi:MAG: threonine synthase, partial [Anaerotignaceae bacterium]